MSYTVRALSAADLTGHHLDALLEVFAAALGYGRRDRHVLAQVPIINRHAERGGFRAFGAFDNRAQLVGFSYGFTSQPGLWWREQISAVMTPEQRAYWLDDAFEVCELHVHPAAQGQHLGSRLLEALVDDLPHSTALLSVMHRSERARQLYASRGWQPVIEDLRFPTEPLTPFSVLGLNLR